VPEIKTLVDLIKNIPILLELYKYQMEHGYSSINYDEQQPKYNSYEIYFQNPKEFKE